MVIMTITVLGQIDPQASAQTIFTELLNSRNIKSPKDREKFLNPPLPTLEFLYQQTGLLDSLTQAQALLDSHLKAGHDICIFGDYDADGVTATATLYLSLKKYLAKQNSTSRLLPFIPDRHRHGYGLSTLAVSEVSSGVAFAESSFTDFSPQLIITVDTGIVANEGIQSFRDQQIDVILTDHHLPDSTLPPANHILHTTITSGAGLAWIFGCHLLGDTTQYLDLATVGIVADMMPLVGFNRSLVTKGLTDLKNTSNPGLKAILVNLAKTNKALTTYDISFGIAPRLNAAGRIYSPLEALRLLCTQDVGSATKLATQIESFNRDRQNLTDQAITQALSQPVLHKIIVITGLFHEGVIGLVAGKLTEKFARPSIVISQNGSDVVKGSARSIPGFNITSFLRSLTTPFAGLGGHDQAAGFSLNAQDLPRLTQEIFDQADRIIDDTLLIHHHTADLELTLSQTTLTLTKMISELEPYGMGNLKPKFLLKDLSVIEDRAMGENGQHHKLTVVSDGLTRELLMFNSSHSHPLQHLKECIVNLDINYWKNQENLQLISTYVQI